MSNNTGDDERHKIDLNIVMKNERKNLQIQESYTDTK